MTGTIDSQPSARPGTRVPHLAHWGAYEAEVRADNSIVVHPFELNAEPSEMLDNVATTVRHKTRITQPMVRAGWLDNGPGPSDGRGSEPFVPVSWERATELLAAELRRVYDTYSASAVYAGSYGWASAGRFHHAQSQVHRFLNMLGGYVSSWGSYSYSGALAILPRVMAHPDEFHGRGTHWTILAEQTDLFVCFGGIPVKNTEVSSGGISRGWIKQFLSTAKERGAEFVLFSPVRDDLATNVEAEWHAVRPDTDVAVMLALAHTLITENLHDTAFLARYATGFEIFERYVLGLDDGQPKDAEWASPIAQVGAENLRSLARRMAAGRTYISMTWSLQRADHGEQTPWMGATLAAMLGQIGVPGGGYGYGLGCTSRPSSSLSLTPPPAFPQGSNPMKRFIPVARIVDMLNNPGKTIDFNGETITYPETHLVYWAGGNPYHHHQDIAGLRRGLAKVDTFVVHDAYWTSTARHADIVLPSTITLERNDIGGSPSSPDMVAMHQAVPPFAQARDDYTIFADLAEQMGIRERFTEGRTANEWVRHLYDKWQERSAAKGYTFPDFDGFWQEGFLQLPVEEPTVGFIDFRNDPDANPLLTPSGKIEIFSQTIADFGYDDCPGHPTWMEPVEWLGNATDDAPLLMIANNPKTRLHSQLDGGAYSQRSKVQDREPIRIHPSDAAARGVADGDVVRVFNARGACLAGVVISDDMRPGVVQLSTGAWYDPLDPSDPDSLCVHGNPNVLTLDKGASKLSQGNIGQHALVQIERWDAPLPPIRVMSAPPIEERPEA